MKLKSFGCSFIFGTDLADAKSGPHSIAPSQLTWPAHLSKYLNRDYECFAYPGAGNLRTLEKVLNQASTDDSAMFVIGWTWIDRFDYTAVSTEPTVRSECIANEVWKTVMPVDTDVRSHNYYRDLHSQYRDKLTSLIYIKTAIDTLVQKNIPFIMIYMDELLFETQWHYTNAVKDLQNYIQPYMTKFENSTFLNWSKQKGFPISKTLHPLENAHQAAFELIRSYNLV